MITTEDTVIHVLKIFQNWIEKSFNPANNLKGGNLLIFVKAGVLTM